MSRISINHLFLLITVTGVLGACNTPKHFLQDSIDTHQLYGIKDTDSTNLAELSWQELFTDDLLKQYIAEGLQNNPDQQIALERVKEAEAYFKQSRATLLPGIDAAARGNYTRNSEILFPNGPRETGTYQLGLEAGWELDIWGKLRSAKRAAYANLLATEAGQKAVETRLIANIATVYYNLSALDAKLVITQQTVQNDKNLVETIKVLKESGRVTGAAIVQSEAVRYAAEVTLPDLEQQIREVQNALCLLLGRTPETIPRHSLSAPIDASLLTTGVPAQLLDNRPDVMQAKYDVMSAFEMTSSARAYFYPALTLTASTGFASDDLNNLLDPAAFAANIIGGLSAPIFNKRGNITRLKVAKAKQQEALLNLRYLLLNAGQEVNNALGMYQTATRKIDLRQQQIDALRKSVDYTRELLNYGSASYIEVLNAQQSLLDAQINVVNDHLQQLNAIVSLYRSLGGGWK
ncbi:TolC family protein [Geofilum sp. OHC36d9]|uniref:TolC family protein n=1 Tax=Geofilum sp. OHC36d9 TaxID=3458413 RepID=UPI004033E314